MKYILFDDSGRLAGRYDAGIHGDNIPELAVPVSDELFFQTIDELDGIWTRDEKTGDVSKQPFPQPSAAELAQAARLDRDARLAASDWVTLRAYDSAAPVPDAWLDYRALLRDVPLQSGFPQSIDWPQAPV